MKCYVVFMSNDPYELPVALYDTLTEVANMLNVSRETIRTGLKRHGLWVDKHSGMCVEAVAL